MPTGTVPGWLAALSSELLIAKIEDAADNLIRVLVLPAATSS